MTEEVLPEGNPSLLPRSGSSHGDGGSPYEIAFLSLCLPLCVIFGGLANQIFTLPERSHDRGIAIKLWIYEFLVSSLPLILSLTCCSSPPWLYAVLILFVSFWGMAFFLFLTQKPSKALQIKEARDREKNPGKKPSWKEELKICQPRYFPFVTNYRSGMLLTTVICILAVDFPQIYPKRFAKTRNFGYGLMDIGVGSFVFAAGLVSQEARRGDEATVKTGKSRFTYFWKSTLETIPMLALGLARLISVKGTGYHEEVAEYGVHWNFFITMALAKFFSSFFFLYVSTSHSWILSILVSVAQEGILTGGGIAEWIMTEQAPRTGLVSSNREGIFSIAGYVAIYLAGIAWGNHLVNNMKCSFQEHVNQGKKIGLWAAVTWAISLLSSELELLNPPSRRLANLNYYNWMVAYNLSLLLMFLGVDLVIIYAAQRFERGAGKLQPVKQKTAHKTRSKVTSTRGRSVSRDVVEEATKNSTAYKPLDVNPHLEHRIPLIFQAVSKNGLAYFLLANLLTGLVNFTISTHTVSSCPAVLMVTGYVFALHCVACIFHAKGITLKFW